MTAVSIAVIDSGANAPHPHLPSLAGGVAFDLEGAESDDWIDRLGHGTAAAAAIHEKAPTSEIHAVRVFHEELATTVPTLVRAIDWATERGIRLVNLSLGTPNAFRASELEPAVARTIAAGTIIVSAYEHDGRRWLPGCMEGVVGVVADERCPRESVQPVEREGRLVLAASPFPRPVPGVPKERNFHGISFAVANATGALAALMRDRPDVRDARAATGLVAG